MLFFDNIFNLFTTMFVFILIVVIVVFLVIIFLVYKFINSNVNSKRSSWVKVETVTPKASAKSTTVQDKEDLSQYCTYCGAKVSPYEKICSSCGAEINLK
ncbi:MAG: zinc-ribbon domain-containing protein [Promethearchaeota archaeon]